MGFEESMIEDGFHDEETYLEHLMDEADREWERQQDEQSSWDDEFEQEEYYEGEYGDEEDDYYKEVRDKYRRWIAENPLTQQLFLAWIDIYYFEYEDYDYFILDKYIEWELVPVEKRIEEIKDYYGNDYPRIYSYFEWKTENLIEEYLRQPDFEYYDESVMPPVQLSNVEILYSKVRDYEEWVRQKNEYEEWLSSVSDEEKKEFFDEVDEYEFDGDSSVEHVRKYVAGQLEYDNVLDFIKQKIMSWYDSDPEKARDLFYYIKCVKSRQE